MAFADLSRRSPTLSQALLVAALGSVALATPESVLYAASTDSPVASALPADATKQHWNVIQTYCFKCHNTEDWAGGFAFDTMTMDDVPGDAEVLFRQRRASAPGCLAPVPTITAQVPE